MKEKLLIVEDQFIEADYLRQMLLKAGYEVTGIARSVPQAMEMLSLQKPDLVLVDIFLRGPQTGIDLAGKLMEENIPFVYLSANSNEEVLNAAKATQPYGFIVKPFREKDLLVTLQIARYRYEHNRNTLYSQEAELRKGLKSISLMTANKLAMLTGFARVFQPVIPFDYLQLLVNVPGLSNHGMGLLRTGFDEYQLISAAELKVISGGPVTAYGLPANNVDDNEFYNAGAFKQHCLTHDFDRLLAGCFGLASSLPLQDPAAQTGFSLQFYSRLPEAYHHEHPLLLGHLVNDIRKCIRQLLAPGQPVDGNAAKPAAYTGADTVRGFEGIVGRSHLLLNVFDQVSRVAPAGTSVLVLGESGTGKEKIAKAIHELSGRREGPFVKINCAALPATLIESELFGHERGAFTGAVDTRVGKFEQADGGTIFLDEVGDMPIELQVKFLRVLQEKEIERLGGRQTIKIDVRIIAATNKNLEKEVAEGRFRLDLYYRLNVFPVTLPALRDRAGDIPALAYFFMNHYNHKAGTKISTISDEVLGRLMDYAWPGNIRELEHLIERSVLMARGTVIDEIDLPGQAGATGITGKLMDKMKTIHENERDYIIAVLKKCKGRIWGPGAAAEILNLPPTTLKSRMHKLGIRKEYIA
ncbi:MAG: response regulator [Chitinophagaceae bacterium]|nr:MAG: response regulator [Chitinophagaceae bacterium]